MHDMTDNKSIPIRDAIRAVEMALADCDKATLVRGIL